LSKEQVTCVDIIISGRVQGVFFRSTMKSVADRAGAKGWVRNAEDGSVEALVQGRIDEIEKVVKWCQVGPEKAIVDSVKVKKTDCRETYRNFAILY
jgi:acylphosphatase